MVFIQKNSGIKVFEMKRIIFLLLALCVIGSVLVGCTNNPPTVDETESTTQAEKAEYTVVIDGNTFTEDFSEENFYEPLNGIEGLFCTKNEETNKYTLKMTATAYTKLKEIKAKDVYSKFDELKNDAENYVADITYDEDFRNVRIVADLEKLPQDISAFDDVIISVAASAMAYQMYTVNGQSVKITIISPDTGVTVIEEFTFPIIIE